MAGRRRAWVLFDTSSYTQGLFTEYTHPGELVFDPFAGFGTTLRVAEEMERRVA